MLPVACLAQADQTRGLVLRTVSGIVAVFTTWTLIASVV
jgi:hypothetical protein